MPRTVEAIVERQARQWQLSREERRGAPHRPTLALSRLHGSGGAELAALLARELKLDVFDHEIVHQIAESMKLSEHVIESLDNRARTALEEWLDGFASHHSLSSAEYRYQLARVVGAVAQHGGAIILGRGAHLVLGAGQALRVLVVAALDARIARIAKRSALSEAEARREIESVDADRRAFLLKHFHADFDDPTRFDLVVNTSLIGIEGACAAIRAATSALPRLEAASGRAIDSGRTGV